MYCLADQSFLWPEFMDIQHWREQIDAIDDELVKLINQRAVFVAEIARLKQMAQLPVHIPEREAQIHARIRTTNPGPLRADALQRIFECIICESRQLEHQILEEADSSTPHR